MSAPKIQNMSLQRDNTPEKGSFPAMLHASQGELAKVIRSGPMVERFMRCCLTEFRLNPELAKCSPPSIMASVMLAAQLNLEIGKSLRQGYLIPYKGECEFQPSYLGLLELARRSGEFRTIDAEIVCEHDVFRYERDPRPQLYHKPDLWNPGAELGAYVIAETTTGSMKFLAMNRAEIEKVRRQSKNANGGPWVTWWSEMAKKSVLKRFLKTQRLSPEMVMALDADVEDLVIDGEVIERRAIAGPGGSKASALGRRLKEAKEEVPPAATEEEATEEAEAVDDVYASEGGAAN